jgi:LPPG:FO 2-phospho-L-lactate transferase
VESGRQNFSLVCSGLCPVNELEDLTIIVNTGDDIKMFGLYIAPDIDIVTYTLAGVVNEQTGWGVSGDTFGCLERLVSYEGGERWFNLGDRDLATHIYRTARLGAGDTLSAVSDHLRRHFGLPMRILPMTDLHTPTTILTAEGPLHFQEYLIRRRAEPRVEGVRFEQIESALPAPGVIEAIRDSRRHHNLSKQPVDQCRPDSCGAGSSRCNSRNGGNRAGNQPDRRSSLTEGTDRPDVA